MEDMTLRQVVERARDRFAARGDRLNTMVADLLAKLLTLPDAPDRAHDRALLRAFVEHCINADESGSYYSFCAVAQDMSASEARDQCIDDFLGGRGPRPH